VPQTLLELSQRLLGENQERLDVPDREQQVPQLGPKPAGPRQERRQSRLGLGAVGREKILLVNA
jgi:hypothetical protein